MSYIMKQSIWNTDPNRPAWHPAEQPRRTAAKMKLKERRAKKNSTKLDTDKTPK